MPRLHRVPRADADGLNRSVVGKHQHEVLVHGAEGADVWRVSEARRGGGAATPAVAAERCRDLRGQIVKLETLKQ